MTDAWTPFMLARLAEEEADEGALRGIAALRSVVMLHQPVLDEYTDADGQSRSSFACGECDAGGVPDNWPCPTVRDLAYIWCNHPGYPGRDHQVPHSVV